MSGLEVIFYSIIALAAGLLIVFTMWENVKLKDELNTMKENSVSLEGINPKIRLAAKDEVIEHIHTYWGK